MSRPPLSLVIPVLNEEGSLEELYRRAAEALPAEAEIIVVDDGSTDGTARLLERLQARDPRLRVVRFRRNFGKSTALEAGFRRARGDVVATMDGDLQEDPRDLLRLADRLAEGYDLVGGWRRVRRDSRLKVWGSRLFNRAVSLLGGLRVRDVNCGLKVFRREVVSDRALAGGFHRFIPLIAHWNGYRVTEMEIEHAPRRHGESRYGGDKAFRALLDLAVILFLLRHEGRPGRFFVAIGALLGAAGLAVSAYLAALRLLSGSIQSRFPLLALGLVLLVVGVQLFSLGLFGELLAYHLRTRRPADPALWEAEREPVPRPGPESAAERDREPRGGKA